MTSATVGPPLYDTVGSPLDELGGTLAGVALQAHLASIVENSDDAILSKDLSGTILSWNRGAERLYGYARHEAIGQPIHLIVPDELRSEVDSFLARVAAGARVDHHDTRRMRRDGSPVEVSITISPIRGADGTVCGASVIARDISERKRLERRLVSIVAEIARQEITIRGQRCATASVGWARIDEAVEADELMIRADLAVYEAKRSWGNGACGYSPDHDARFDGPVLDDARG